MKGPNGKSVILNRATVSISATVYDRRALDCTDDKALVNSLNHLTFLTSSSAKVREAMIHDGAIERLIDILYECRDPKTKTEIAMFAWKWVLSLQCLVLAGTRGSEQMRKKLVDAGIIPILATILDNHFLTRKNHSLNHDTSSSNSPASRNNYVGGNTTSNTILTNTPTSADTPENFGSISNEDILITDTHDDNNTNHISHVLRHIRSVVDEADRTIFGAQEEIDKFMTKSDSSLGNQLISKRRMLGEEEMELLNVVELIKCFQVLGDCDINSDYHKIINEKFQSIDEDPFLSQELKRRLEITNLVNPSLDPFNNFMESHPLSQAIPRTFENGLILPATDDVIWSLQLLAFISKYSYLRYPLSSTYFINGLSFRSKNHPPPLETDCASTDFDELMNDSNDEPFTAVEFERSLGLSDSKYDILKGELEDKQTYQIRLIQEKRLENLKKLSNENDKNIVEDFVEILKTEDQVDKMVILERIRLNSNKIKHESLGKLRTKNKIIYRNKLKEYSKKWDYDNSWDEFETPLEISSLIDKEIQPFVTLNIFPLIERFTVRSWFSEDICYWAAVVVRNANRKDEKMGGRRQCAHFGCGKWEDHPKQFSKCRRCKRAKYCSRECQTKAWLFHKHWCVPANQGTSAQQTISNTSNSEQ